MEYKNFVEAIHYVTGDPVKIEIDDSGFISGIKVIPAVTLKNPGLFVSPGLIDGQINGCLGVDFSGNMLTIPDMKRVISALQQDGVTSFMPTVITNSRENLLNNFRNLALTLTDPEIRNSVAGFHLEGPYLSTEQGFYGCHSPVYLRNPSWSEFCRFREAAEGNIREVTVSPELDGAMEFIRLCSENNIMVAIGHSNASSCQVDEAVRNGARLSTHLGNGCANTIDRHRNPIWPQLANDLLTPSIIADGHHLLPEEIRVFYRVKGPDNIFIVSDVSPLAGMSPGRYTYFGSEVEYTSDGFIKNPLLNCLAGASLPLKRGVETLLDLGICSHPEAIKMASENVSGALGLDDRGVLEPGKRADLILYEIKHNKLHVRQTWVAGKVVFSSL